jgi:hypothetical protein
MFRFWAVGAETKMQEQFNSIAPQMAKAKPTVFPLPLDAVRKTVSVLGLKWL